MTSSGKLDNNRGRPLDPSVEQRTEQAVIEVYSETGWAGFTVDKVASRAKVGKAAIYRRWPTKQELLTNAISGASRNEVTIEDTGHIRRDLETMANKLAQSLQTPRGLAELRLQLEAKIYPDVLDSALDDIRSVWIEASRECVTRASSRGQLIEGAPTGLIFDTIRGAIINRFLLTPSHRHTVMLESASQFSRRIVNVAISEFEAPN